MSGGTVLIAEDDAGIRTVLARALKREGHDVRAMTTVGELVDAVRGGGGDIVVTDVVLPDGSGLDALPRLKSIRPGLPVIVTSAQNTFMTAIQAAERGAYEYLPKPFDLDELVALVARALAEPRAAVGPGDVLVGEAMPLIGRSPAMQEVYRILARVMQTDLTVLVTGESGTGKELVARALHDFGRRKRRAFVAVNMAAIPRELIEAELFGHEKGAFTGANARVAGRFEQAEGGTLFLDEIGDMPMEAQTRLLRVLQEREYTTLGGSKPKRADVRIVAATNQDLTHLIDEGRFREDLYYRLNVVPLRLPALRERVADVPELCEHFLARAVDAGLPRRSLSAAATARLAAHRWPGNVRELENVVRRLVVMALDEVIDEGLVADVLGPAARPAERGGTPTDLEGAVRDFVAAEMGKGNAGGASASAGGGEKAGAKGARPSDLHAALVERVERPLLAAVLAEVGGNQLRAASILGLNRNTLRKRIRELGISLPKGGRVGP